VLGLLDWLASLPAVVLHLSLGILAAAENIFPPLPTDTVVAFGIWIAARGEANPFFAFLATWLGNSAGAAGMYVLGRRHGTRWMRRRFPRLVDEAAERRLRALYSRYGLLALVVSRFIPGLRAVVPPFAGALRIPAVGAVAAMAIASGIWYGVIAYLAYRAGSDWTALTQTISRSGRFAAVAAAVLVLAGLLAWLVHRRRTRVVE
jgi:membrane protein DedA with SNARE-associated domain